MNSLLQIKIERNMLANQDMKDVIASLGLDTSLDNLDKHLELNSFKDYCKMLFTDTSDTQSCMMN